MSTHAGSKLNRLGRELPEGLLVDANWLEERGYSRSLRSHYVAAGWLEQPARGVFRRPRGALSWEQVVISLQTLLRLPVSVGGRTALEVLGYAHYLRQSHRVIHLYTDVKLPGWTSKLPGPRFVSHNRGRLLPSAAPPSLNLDSISSESERTLPGAFRVIPWGHWHWPLVVSTPERAILELLDELPTRETFHDVDMLMEGLVDISPRRMQTLLEQTSSIKVKRLFFFFSERHDHRWLDRLSSHRIDLGKGKRMIAKGGKLDRKYQITVPEDLHGV